jgi:F-type H+-transporting ATPase subunit a
MEEIGVAAHEMFNIGGLIVTNTNLWVFIIVTALALSLGLTFSKASIIPGKIQNFFEWIMETFIGFIDSITGSRAKTLEVFPLAMTIFLLVWCSNLLELVPGLGLVPVLRSPSSDLNFTIALALISVVFINYSAMRKLGLFSYLGKFFNFTNPLMFFVGILEFIGEFTRIISLAMRLFGNLFAGEILLIVVSTGISWTMAYLVPLPFLALEVLVGFIQAFIFSSLVIVFYSTATQAGHG